MKQVIIKDLKLDGEEMSYEQMDIILGNVNIQTKCSSHKWKRKIMINEHEITWNLYEHDYFYLIDGKVKLHHKNALAKLLGITMPTLDSRLEKILKKGSVTVGKQTINVKYIESQKLYLGKWDHREYTFSDKRFEFKTFKYTYDLIDFKGIPLVRQLINGRLLNTLSYDLGKQFL